jgi:hypothetical protein
VRVEVYTNQEFLLGLDRIYVVPEKIIQDLDSTHEYIRIKHSFPAMELLALVGNLKLERAIHCFYAVVRE